MAGVSQATNQPISRQALEGHLWGAATLLRGLIDAGEYKQFIFPLLFYKRLSDVWDEAFAEVFAGTKNTNEAIAVANDRFIIPDGAHWNDVCTVAKDVGNAVQHAMQAIETANPRLDGIFGNTPWSKKKRLPDYTLKKLLEHFSGIVLSLANVPEDELGNAYEYLIKKFADDSGHTAQEFYTNRTVVHLMVQMLAPQPGETIYDPTCGTGGMLISALAEVKRGGEHRTLKLYGQERNHMTASIARMNLVLHGVETYRIARGDTLEKPAFTEYDPLTGRNQPCRFNVVLANPPYSIKRWNRKAFQSDDWGRNFLGTPPQGRADYAFFQHILKSLDFKTGRCAILFPHGVLFRKEEAQMRKKLLEADLVECVLGLGANLFYNSPMEACVVVCRTSKPAKRKGKVLFINAVNEVARVQAQSFLKPEHQQRILSVYQTFKDEPGFAKAASLEEISAQDYNLSIPLYVQHKSNQGNSQEAKTLAEVWADWEQTGRSFWQEMDAVVKMLDGLVAEEASHD